MSDKPVGCPHCAKTGHIQESEIDTMYGDGYHRYVRTCTNCGTTYFVSVTPRDES
ncbi:hypothetical protein LCGC14_0410900 [marine sediment metagenome]|uniref:Uncharacterized protein n=1 Tax=marine sediment metagenome TaxID=412755 RepID=A0A0F9SZK5_9ZZZZ